MLGANLGLLLYGDVSVITGVGVYGCTLGTSQFMAQLMRKDLIMFT